MGINFIAPLKKSKRRPASFHEADAVPNTIVFRVISAGPSICNSVLNKVAKEWSPHVKEIKSLSGFNRIRFHNRLKKQSPKAVFVSWKGWKAYSESLTSCGLSPRIFLMDGASHHARDCSDLWIEAPEIVKLNDIEESLRLGIPESYDGC